MPSPRRCRSTETSGSAARSSTRPTPCESQGKRDPGSSSRDSGPLIRRLAADTPPKRVPSGPECRFCDISVADCPEREGDNNEPEGGRPTTSANALASLPVPATFGRIPTVCSKFGMLFGVHVLKPLLATILILLPLLSACTSEPAPQPPPDSNDVAPLAVATPALTTVPPTDMPTAAPTSAPPDRPKPQSTDKISVAAG